MAKPIVRRILKVAAVAVAAGLMFGQGALAQTPVKVASTAKEIFDNLPFFVAADQGLYKKHGLDVQVTHFGGGGEVVRAVSGGAMDIGMVATTAAIIAAGRGQPLKLISAWSAPAYGIVWVVPAASPIKSINDMAGKKAGISRPGSVTHTGLLAALEATKLKDKVQVVPVGGPGDSWAAVKVGRIDVAWHTAPDVYSLVDGGEARILFQISDYLTNYQQGALVAMENYLAKNGDTVRKFLQASAEAVAFIERNPAAAARIGAKATGIPEKSVMATIKAAPPGFFRIGRPTDANLAGSLEEAVGTGALKKKPPVAQIVDTRFLP